MFYSLLFYNTHTEIGGKPNCTVYYYFVILPRIDCIRKESAKRKKKVVNKQNK